MSIDLVTKFVDKVDEVFKEESKRELLTNRDYDWTGAHIIKIYKITTASMNDYDRGGTGTGATGSRYGAVEALDATTEELVLAKDRSFTFAIDKMDEDETMNTLRAGTALARQVREIIIPEIDTYVYGVMATNAGTKPTAKALTASNIYDEIMAANQVMDDNEVPETERILVVTPSVYVLLKKALGVMMSSDIGDLWGDGASEMRAKGVVGLFDGMAVIKVPAVRLPDNFGFMIAHPVATVAPVKLEDYKIHEDPPGISGALVEGRICYDAFVLDNKTKAIYYQAQPAPATAG